MTFSCARARVCVDYPLFLHARTYAETKSATLFAVLKSKTFNRIQSYAIYLSESLNVAPREHACTAGFFRDKLFRFISYVTIFSLVETTTTSRADIYKCEHPRCKTPAFKHHGLRCNRRCRHCCQEFGACMYTHEK